MCLCWPSSIHCCRPSGGDDLWLEDNHRSGAALAMRHRLSGISDYRLNGLGKEDERIEPGVLWHLYLYLMMCTNVIGRWSGVAARVVWQASTESSPCLVSCVVKCRCLVRSRWCFRTASGKSSLLVRRWFAQFVVTCQLVCKLEWRCFNWLKGECNLDIVWQSDCLFYISDNKFRHIDIAFCAFLLKKSCDF